MANGDQWCKVKMGLLGLIMGVVCAQGVWAQATIKRDGQWRAALGAGGSVATGNNRSTNITMTGEVVRATEVSKWSFNGRLLYAASQGAITSDNQLLSSQYDKDLNQTWFTFSKLEYLRDQPANLDARLTLMVGPGLHLIRNDNTTLDVSIGLAYTLDRYAHANWMSQSWRGHDGRGEWTLSEDSTHKISRHGSFRQKLTASTNTGATGGYRYALEVGLSLAINSRMNLTTSFTQRHEKDPGLGLNNDNGLLLTGVSLILD